MAVAPPPALNGRPRKQLSEQLDRLDDVINGMEECLPQAVADAAREGIRQAFRDVIGELVADPAMIDKLRSSITTDFATVPAKPSAFSRLKARIQAAASRVGTFLRNQVNCAVQVPRKIAGAIRKAYTTTRTGLACWMLLALPLKSILTAGVVIGVAVASISYLAPHHVAALLSGMGASMTAMTVQVARWFQGRRRFLVTLS